MVLDLKGSFFSLLLAPKSQSLFPFEWYDPGKGHNGQLTCARLLQAFKNSPAIFNEVLYEDLGEYWRGHTQATLLQYVDDLLIAAGTEEDCR